MDRVRSTDGVTVALHDLGGDGPPLLLTHATGFCGRVWEPVARRLAAAFHCWAPDLRGHGESETPAGIDFHWSGFADDVLAVVDHLAPTAPLVAAGHSKGGAALLLAQERRPDTFHALYCYEPVVFPDGSPLPEGMDNPLAEGARRRRDRFASFDEAYDHFASKPPFDALRADSLRAYVEGGFRMDGDGTVTLRCRPASEAQTYEMAPAHDAFTHLGEITIPVTVATGSLSGHSPAAFAPAIVEALPHGDLVVFEHLGHFGPLEDPDVIADDILRAVAPLA